MVVTVDQALCSGCGLCIELLPDIFAWGAEGKAVVLKEDVDESTVEEVADQCPVEAIDL